LMVLIMIWRPRGLLAYRDPTIRLSAAGRGHAIAPGGPASRR
jgi:branched-chain amino acid transport system permease protein